MIPIKLYKAHDHCDCEGREGSLSLPRTKQTGGHIISLDTPSWPLGCLSGYGHNNTNNKDRKIITGTGTFKGTNRDCTENSQREDTQSK